jgi:hypothetical protein
MVNHEILSFLNSGLCQITFTKRDGTERTITGTLVSDLIPEDKRPNGENRFVRSPEVQPVYEVDLEEWRSFRWDKVISYNAE